MLGLTGAQAGPWRQDADRVYNFVAAWRSAGAVAKLHSMKDHLEAVRRAFMLDLACFRLTSNSVCRSRRGARWPSLKPRHFTSLRSEPLGLSSCS